MGKQQARLQDHGLMENRKAGQRGDAPGHLAREDMTRAEVETLGSTILRLAGLDGWRVRGVYERDDVGDEDDIAGSRGRCYFDEQLIWINMRYARDEQEVRQILAHEIAHARVGPREAHDRAFEDEWERMKRICARGSDGKGENEGRRPEPKEDPVNDGDGNDDTAWSGR
jgi:hypothetical protein